MAESEVDRKRLLFRFNAIALQYNMISSKKTKSLVIAKELIKCKLVVQEKIIEQIVEIEYLDMRTSSDGKLEDEVT